MKETTALVLLVLANTPAPAHAQSMSLLTSSGGELGIQISKYKYDEEVNGSFFMSTEGDKLGLTGSFTIAFDGNWYISGDGRYASGLVNYTGSGTKGSNPDVLTELRVVAGQDFDFGDYLLSPYAGFGVRSLSNDLRGYTSTGAAGYRRESSYTYLPLGLTHRLLWGAQSRISTSLEYDHFVGGQQTSYTTDVGAVNNLKNSQKKGFGARVNMAYETGEWSAGFFYNYWNIQDSDVSSFTTPPVVFAAIEPHNTTREFGIQFRYRFN